LFVDQGRLTALIAHRDGQLFHWAVCKWGEHIPIASRVEFATREDALDAGYKPCAACHS
jgi:micrococcal nuclease